MEQETTFEIKTGKVRVKTLQRRNWSGFTMFDMCSNVFYMPLDKNIKKPGYYKTGISYEEQEYLESALNLEPGTLNNNSEYWESTFVKLTTDNKELDLENPSDYISYKILVANKRYVAASLEEAEKNPSAKFVIVDEENEAKIANKKREAKAKAYAKYTQLTLDEKRQILTLDGKRSDSISGDVIDNLIGLMIEEKPEKFLSYISDTNLSKKFFIVELVQFGILSENKGTYDYGDTHIGVGEAAVLEFIKNKKNQETVIVWQKELANRKNQGK